MKPRTAPLPEPTTPDEAAALLWSFLRRRLAERRAFPAAVGQPENIPHRLPGPNGHLERVGWRADVPLDGDGRVLLGGLLHAWPDRLSPRPETMPMVLDAVADLVRQGVLRHSFDSAHALYITRHGAALLDRNDEELPAGDLGRVARLEAEFAGLPDLDLIAAHYAEAIGAYRASLDYSATVMIGVCYEAGLLLLARAIADYELLATGSVPGMNRRHRDATQRVQAGEYVPASAVEGLVYDVLCALGAGLGSDQEWVGPCLRSTCDFVRSLRNAVGHLTERAVLRYNIAVHILFLPASLGRVRSHRFTVAVLPWSSMLSEAP